MKRLMLALLVVSLVSLTANTCFAYISGPQWPTDDRIASSSFKLAR